MSLGLFGLVIEIHFQNHLAIERQFHPGSLAGNFIFVPFLRLEQLFPRSDGSVKPAGQFIRLRGLAPVVSGIHHLQFQPIKRRIARQGKAQAAAAVALLPQFEFKFENEIGIFLFADELAPARVAPVENPFFDFPGAAAGVRIFDVGPVADQPPFRRAVLWE
jgi:hypothetical protein